MHYTIPKEPKAILLVDISYSYIEKSSNFRALGQSFSMHKECHLVKPVFLVAPDGFILDIQRPYFSNSRNNDAAFLRSKFDKDVNGLRVWLRHCGQRIP